MKNKIKDIINSLDFKTKMIIKNGFKFCIFLCVISLSLLVTYIFWVSIPLVFNVGIIFLKNEKKYSKQEILEYLNKLIPDDFDN